MLDRSSIFGQFGRNLLLSSPTLRLGALSSEGWKEGEMPLLYPACSKLANRRESGPYCRFVGLSILAYKPLYSVSHGSSP